MHVKRFSLALALGLGLTLGPLWLLVAGPVSPARAMSITVDTTTDEHDGNCWDGDCSLRDAIIAANNSPGPDTIALGSGTYVLSITGPGDDIGWTGDLDIADALTITGLGPDQTIIDANGIDRVFDLRPGADTVVISGVTIINGNVSGADGGGIHNIDADLTLVNSVLASNSAGNRGGGVYIYKGSTTLSGGQIVSNTATWYGGGVYVDQSSVTLSGGQIISNTATWYGGGVYIARSTAAFTQTGSASTIAGNTADRGGGVYVHQGSATLSGARYEP